MAMDKYRLSDTISETHVSPFSLDDAPPERPSHVDHLDSREHAEERRGDHGRDRDDDARVVETVPGFCLSAPGPDDPGGAPQEARRRPVRADCQGEGRARVAIRDAGPQGADGGGHAERDGRLRLVLGGPEPFRSVEDRPLPGQDQERRRAARRACRDHQAVILTEPLSGLRRTVDAANRAFYSIEYDATMPGRLSSDGGYL